MVVTWRRSRARAIAVVRSSSSGRPRRRATLALSATEEPLDFGLSARRDGVPLFHRATDIWHRRFGSLTPAPATPFFFPCPLSLGPARPAHAPALCPRAQQAPSFSHTHHTSPSAAPLMCCLLAACAALTPPAYPLSRLASALGVASAGRPVLGFFGVVVMANFQCCYGLWTTTAGGTGGEMPS